MERPASLRATLPGGRRVLRRFAPHVRGQRLMVVGGFAALLAEVLLRLAEPWPLGLIVDRITTPEGGGRSGWAALDGLSPETFLVAAAGALAVIAGLRALAAYLSTVAFALAGNRVVTAIRGDVFRHLQRLSLRYHARARTGDLVQRLTGDVGRLQEVMVTAALPLLGNVVTLLGMMAVMAWLDWRLTIVALATFPIFSFILLRLTRRISSASRDQRKNEGALASSVSEALGAIRVVQTYSLEGRLEDDFDRQNTQSLRAGVRGTRLAAALERRTDLIVAVATGMVLLLGGRRVLHGALSPGELVVFVTYLKGGFKPMRDLAKYSGRIAKAISSGERIVDLLDTETDVVPRPGARRAPRLRGHVRFSNVSLQYSPGRDVLKRIDLTVRPGERVALVGPSGSGKSSLVGLIPRLDDPTSGTVCVDGVDVRDYTLESLRSQVAVVLQESVLFATTVRENIALGAPGATAADVVRGARLANAHGFIAELPQGYDTVLGERGATLSGGQRQRIAIARAAVRAAPIVILDEPGTGLDQENRRLVGEALRRLTAGRTTFVIAHDLETLAGVDRVIVIDKGAIVEQGTHAELLLRDGRYAALFSTRAPAARTRRPSARTGFLRAMTSGTR